MSPVEAVLIAAFTLMFAAALTAVGDLKDDRAQWRRRFQLRWTWLLAWTALMLVLGCVAGLLI